MPKNVKFPKYEFPLIRKYFLNEPEVSNAIYKKDVERVLGVLENEHDELLLNRTEWKHESVRLEKKIATLEANLSMAESRVEEKQERIAQLEKELKTARASEYGTGALFLTAMKRIVRDDHNCEAFAPPYDKCLMTRAELTKGISLVDFKRRLSK